MSIQIESSWNELLKEEFEQPYFSEIKQAILASKSSGHKVFPPGSLIFNAFDTTPVHQVKVVIIGQDPYHKQGQAMGLSFSVPKGVRVPPSLKNIYKEINRDLGIPPADHGDLSNWAHQGVFLLNAMLTVEEGNAGSHKKIGWQRFTDAVIHKLSQKRDRLIFMLWGNFAKGKKELIVGDDHLILESVHPSPLAGNGFQGNGHFSAANNALSQWGQEPINWAV